MVRIRASYLALAAACLAACAVLPGVAAGHQRATLDAGVLTITGDYAGQADEPKPNDLVTLEHDRGSDELIVGNDVFGPHPSQCRPTAENPQRIIRCPLSLITEIRIQTGIGSDRVIAEVPAPLKAAMGSGNDAFEGGSEVDFVDTGSGSDKAYGGAGPDRLKGGSDSDKLFGEGGDDRLFGGSAPDKLYGGSGRDQCDPGTGQGRLFSC